jgi:hypothetical protein
VDDTIKLAQLQMNSCMHAKSNKICKISLN